jgi:branched-chain amino acid transport system substrate-binding protein
MKFLTLAITRRPKPSRRSFFNSIWVGVCLVLTPEMARAAGTDAAPREIVVGALLSLTGDWSSLGVASKAALQIAVEDMNAEFKQAGIATVVKLRIVDTKLDPVLAKKGLLELTRRHHVSVVIGPQSSSEVRAIKPLADRLGVLVVSQGSTASSLALAGDSIFRFCPTDVEEGKAIAGLMSKDGITTVVPLWRGDPGNDGLHDSTEAAFTGPGRSFRPGLQYPESTTGFADAVDEIATQVRDARAVGGAKVAVYLASFDEGITILELASAYPELSAVRWYSGDGLAQSVTLLKNPVAAAFAIQVGFTAPVLGLDPAAAGISQPISNEILGKIGYTPDAFALAAYDAAVVAVLSCQEIRVSRRVKSRTRRPERGSKGPRSVTRQSRGRLLTHRAQPHYRWSRPRIALLKPTFVRNANRYWGATGATTLNAAGDRLVGNYDFFSVVEEVGVPSWSFSESFVNGQVSN